MIKSLSKISLLYLMFAGMVMAKAQNTSLGHVHGTIKDTVVTYTEDPEKHAHTETTVVNTDKGGNHGPRNSGTEAHQNNDQQSTAKETNVDTTAQPATVTTADTTTINTTAYPEGATDLCSCTSLHIAYGIAGVSLLALIIVLALYVSERNRNRRA